MITKKRAKAKMSAEYGCDVCKKSIDLCGVEKTYLGINVFRKSGETIGHHLCSWKCVFKFLKMKKAKTDYFISLPCLLYDETKPGLQVKDFWKAIKEMGSKK